MLNIKISFYKIFTNIYKIYIKMLKNFNKKALNNYRIKIGIKISVI